MVLLPLTAQAAEGPRSQERSQERGESRQQGAVIQESSINSFSAQPAQQQPRISSRQAMNIATGSYEGRVLSIRRDDDNWRVRMDREGTVFNVFVNAVSGNVSSTSD